MRKEVTVKGSSALGCETMIVREYLRVSCRGKNDSGGSPTSLRILKGGRGEAYTFASGGVTSLVVPFVDGIDLEAEFSWTDKSHKLVVKWPRGAPMPQVAFVFEGAKRGAIGRCMRTCGAGRTCPAGLTCVGDLGPVPVCTE
jgi:hypothetical protein